MSRSFGNTAIVLVQGSFQLPVVYQKLNECLEALGHSVEQPVLPSCGIVEGRGIPEITLADDAKVVHQAVNQLVEIESKLVVVVCHSYGGLVASEAIPETLTRASRKSKGKEGGVVHLFMFAAFLLEEGQSVLEVFGESPNSDVRQDGRFIIKNAENLLYNDLERAEAEQWASRLVFQSYKVQTTRLTRAAYKYLPCTYLITDNDQACPPTYQEMFAKQAEAAIYHCSTGHSPMLSEPQMLANRISEVAAQAVATEGMVQ